MNPTLTPIGYQQTQAKLDALQRRLETISARQDLDPGHKAAVIQSYRLMASQYLREIKLYEARHSAGAKQ